MLSRTQKHMPLQKERIKLPHLMHSQQPEPIRITVKCNFPQVGIETRDYAKLRAIDHEQASIKACEENLK